MKPELSVIVPTRNRVDRLALCLRSLSLQTLDASRFEVVVIDNGSTDGTPEMLSAFEGRIRMSWRTEDSPGLHVGRHAGMKAATSESLVFVDDDIRASPDWAAAIVDALRDPGVVMVGGNNIPDFERDPPAWLEEWWHQPAKHGRVLGHLSILDMGSGAFDIDPGLVWGCNFAIRRSILERAGGFHPDAFPADLIRLRGDGESHVSEWVRAKGLRAWFDSRASVHHFVPAERMTPDYFERRSFAQGISDSYTAIRRNSSGAGGSLGAPAKSLTRLRQGISALLGRMSGRNKDLCLVQEACARAYWKGYEFHQTAVDSSEDLRNWVLKADYIS